MTRGLMIAAPRSGSGKTTATLGLLRAFKRRGMDVVGLKSGPDYIDPPSMPQPRGRRASISIPGPWRPTSWRGLLCGRRHRARLRCAKPRWASSTACPGESGRTGASADVAAALGMPVLMVIDVSGQAQSAAAIVKGCATYDRRLKVAGVIVNRVGSERHRRLVVEAIEAIGVPVVGALPRKDAIALPERHLGLVQAGETEALDARLETIADFIEAHVDCDRVLALAEEIALASSAPAPSAVRPPGQRIALARDAAFSFIYPHLVQGWRAAGAEIVPFSPLADEAPRSDCDVCWLPGGYPELHAGRLAAATRFRHALRRFGETRPVHGECGGYMALGQSLTDASGAVHAMAGLLGVETSFAKRRMTLGYREARIASDCALGTAGSLLRGHEFHYATIVATGDDDPFAFVRDVYGSPEAPAGSRRGLFTGSFFHVIAEA